MTKFLIIPLMAAYYGHRIDLTKAATILRVVPDAAIGLLAASVLAASSLSLVSAMMAVTCTFLFVAATPNRTTCR